MLKAMYYVIKTTYRIIGFRNILIFFASIIWNIKSIITYKTIMYLDFIISINVKYKKKTYQIKHYYELSFFMGGYEHIIDNIENNMLFFDIGAHFGEASNIFLNQSIGGHAILFEPNPNNAKIMEIFFKKNNIQNYTIHKIGLGNEGGEKSFFFDNKLAYTGNFGIGGKYKITTTIEKLDNIKLDDILTKYNNILFKIDVEGFEIETIKGMQETLKRMIKKQNNIKLIIEMNDKKHFKEILTILQKISPKVQHKQITDCDFLFRM